MHFDELEVDRESHMASARLPDVTVDLIMIGHNLHCFFDMPIVFSS